MLSVLATKQLLAQCRNCGSQKCVANVQRQSFKHGRSWGQWQVDATKRAFTRASLTEHKSALTDHATQENHMIHWTKAAVIDRESDRPTRWIKEAVHIRKIRSTSHESRRRQLSTQSHLWLLSWHDSQLLRKVSEGLSTSFVLLERSKRQGKYNNVFG